MGAGRVRRSSVHLAPPTNPVSGFQTLIGTRTGRVIFVNPPMPVEPTSHANPPDHRRLQLASGRLAAQMSQNCSSSRRIRPVLTAAHGSPKSEVWQRCLHHAVGVPVALARRSRSASNRCPCSVSTQSRCFRNTSLTSSGVMSSGSHPATRSPRRGTARGG